MLHEHAVTFKERLTVANLDYLIKKANRLGLAGREVTRVYQQEDVDETELFFEVTELRNYNER